MKQCIYLAGWVFLFTVLGCKSTPKETPSAPQPAPTEPAVVEIKKVSPNFNEDSAYLFVKEQVAFGPRVPGTAAHKLCADYLYTNLKKYAHAVVYNSGPVKTFDGKIYTTKNIIASFNPKVSKRVILCAHWDSRPFADHDIQQKDKPIDGANDGASGVGVLMEIARHLKNYPPTVGVDIILFDLEDYGQPEDSKFPPMEDSYCLGSQYWSKHLHAPSYHADFGILLDMVGAAGAQFAQEGTSLQHSQDIVRKVWDIGNQLGYPNFSYYQKSPIIDDHYYITPATGIPVVDIIEYNPDAPSRTFSKTWHTHADNMQVISKETLKSVGQTVMEVVWKEK
jgi:hypothetical protein